MAEQRLHDAEVGPASQQMAGEGMAEHVRRDARFTHVILIGHSEGAMLATLAARATEAEALVMDAHDYLGLLRRRGLFVLFSDCFGDLDDLGKALRIVRARGHDHAPHVSSPFDWESRGRS